MVASQTTLHPEEAPYVRHLNVVAGGPHAAPYVTVAGERIPLADSKRGEAVRNRRVTLEYHPYSDDSREGSASGLACPCTGSVIS